MKWWVTFVFFLFHLHFLIFLQLLCISYIKKNNESYFTKEGSTGWYGSVDWVLAYEPKGRWFYSQSGHMPGLRARSPVEGVWEAADWCFSHTSMFLSLSFSLPSPLSKNKYIKSLKKTKKKVNYINKTSGKVGKIFVTNDKGLMSLIWESHLNQ